MKFLEASNIVKPIKVLLSVVLAVTILLAFTVSVPALGFDAEEAYTEAAMEERELMLSRRRGPWHGR